MKWSYTSGKINVSSGEEDQQFLLEELIEEASKHRAKKRRIFIFFVVLSLILFAMQYYGSNLKEGMSVYFYIGFFLTPIIISLIVSSITYVLVRRSPKKFKDLIRHFKD
jgi:RsiW-degrading membrane proteinase PrsW (M82 family)